jgi:alpha-L-rhamnosidase
MTPGFKEIEIKSYVGDLTYARGSIKTVRGVVSSLWKRTEDSLTMEVAIPVNSKAKVSIPKIGLQNVTVTESYKTVCENQRYVKTVPGITARTETDDYITFDAGSDNYTFRLNDQR